MNFEDEFKPKARSLFQVFKEPGKGFVIPYYQREYSWDKENIKQLMDDLIGGVKRLISYTKNMRFLGTAIVMVRSPSDLEEIEDKALPARVENIIDGQQRISTFAILSIIIHKKIESLKKEIPNEEPFKEVLGPAKYWQERLENVYSLDPGPGEANRKPIVIRKGEDKWTFKGDSSSHKSYVSSFIYEYIHNNIKDFEPSVKGLVRKNVDLLEDYIKKISNAHVTGSDLEDRYPSDANLIASHIQESIWSYEKEDLSEILMEGNEEGVRGKINSLANLFLLTFFFLQRCCMTVIEPDREELAFDMFQSLNATGTPLTAIEVFKPLVVKSEEDHGEGYKDSPSQSHFQNVERMFSRVTAVSTKNTRTDKLVTNFALSFDGKKLSSRFGRQRKWIQQKYLDRDGISKRREFTKVFSDVSSFLYDAWILYDPDGGEALDIIQGHDEAQLASVCFLYLKSVNHKIANGHIARFYSNVVNNVGADPESEFIEAVKATAGFFTLWRATQSTSGLDNVYRRLMRHGGLENDPVVQPMRWTGPEGSLTSSNLKKYFRSELDKRNIDQKEKWVERSTPGNLTYDTIKKVCRFCLFLSSHDTVSDESSPGLMKQGTQGSSNYLTVRKWNSSDLELEHIAPADPPDEHGWDDELYKIGSFQEIGNLTLLPKDVNISVGNKNWRQKRLYYKHLGLDDPEKKEKLKEEAESEGIDLSKDVTETLMASNFHKHLDSLTDRENPIDHKFVRKRGRRISEIVWDRISEWIFD